MPLFAVSMSVHNDHEHAAMMAMFRMCGAIYLESLSPLCAHMYHLTRKEGFRLTREKTRDFLPGFAASASHYRAVRQAQAATKAH
jgi:hypothetical protein